MNKISITDVDLAGKKVLVRVDFNVPLNEKHKITDDTRIRATFPTIKHLLKNKCKIILMSHLGRPKGKVVPELSLMPVAIKLSNILKGFHPVFMARDCIGPMVEKMAANMRPSSILLLENLRFHPEEEKNDQDFARKLASLAEFFVQDAFGTLHRAHASTAGVTNFLPSACGFLVKKEIDYLGSALDKPQKPFLAILGGAKVSGKIDVIENLLNKVNTVAIGGAMAYTFLKAEGINVGSSRVEEDKVDLAKDILKRASEKKVTMLIPCDHVVTQKIDGSSESKVVGTDIPEGWIGVDIGPLTSDRYEGAIKASKTIVWNGPMGIFEVDKFSEGTMKIARQLADATKTGATTIIGGGDSVAAVSKASVTDKMSHISTGGGASLEFLEGKQLPGIVAIKDKE
ncbi:MAG: phosphoglycerate kinase [bacterium]